LRFFSGEGVCVYKFAENFNFIKIILQTRNKKKTDFFIFVFKVKTQIKIKLVNQVSA